MAEKLYKVIANLIQARINCVKSDNQEWVNKHTEKLNSLCKRFLASGSGFDSGTKIDIYASTPNKLVLYTSFHHMNDRGFYNGFTDHKVIVTPDLCSGFNLKITGPDKRAIKEHIGEIFVNDLNKEVNEQ